MYDIYFNVLIIIISIQNQELKYNNIFIRFFKYFYFIKLIENVLST